MTDERGRRLIRCKLETEQSAAQQQCVIRRGRERQVEPLCVRTNPIRRARFLRFADTVAGMTDRFALTEHQRLFDPYTIEGLPSA